MATLVACAESDLVELHEQQLDDAIASTSTPVVAPANPDDALPPPSNLDLTLYELAFIDEFQGDSVDAAKWKTSLWSADTIVYNQLQYYVDTQNSAETAPSPFSFDGESLIISATTTTEEQRADANEQPYLSGILSTRDLFSITYGYVEARIKVQEGRGIWPSFWMLGAQSDALNPEVYVFEYDGSKPDSVFHNYNYLDTDGNLRSPGQQEVQVDGFSDGFRTIGLRWGPGELLYYVDGSPSYRIIGENVPAESMYLVLNLAMGGVWPGAPDGTTPDPATLAVDYVRVYKLREQ